MDKINFQQILNYLFILISAKSCEQLARQNAALRDQLEESHRNNEVLTADLQKLTADWESLREEMAIKEDEWKEEEVVYLIIVFN